MNDEIEIHDSQDRVVELVKEAKKRPLPKSSKALFTLLLFALVFTGGIVYGKHKATATTGTGLNLSSLSSGNFSSFAAGGGGFGGGRFRNGGNNGAAATGTTGGALTTDGAGTAAATVATDVAGTVVSVTDKEVVIETLSGEKQTFPVTETTKVRASTKLDLSKVKSGDIVTIKPDDDNSAKTIMVVK
ncbi:MAG: hypothetical protein WDO06_04090 [Actinomycetota bacterium]